MEELRALPAGPPGFKGENALCSVKPGFTPGLEYMVGGPRNMIIESLSL